MKLFDTTLAHLQRSLDVRLVRHNVLAGNLANADTPGYAPKDVDFKAVMATAFAERGAAGVDVTDPRHLDATGATAGGGEVPVTDVAGATPTLDGNRVDLDRTMVSMAENGLQYAASAKAAGKKLAILRYVASDGQA
jgi:flagellar basal-body rod protein FlgB